MKPLFVDEFVNRITVKPEIFSDPERLLAYGEFISGIAWATAQNRHYNGYGVGAALPVRDREGHGKMLATSNYRPDPSTANADIRVCAEQALWDDAIHDGDQAVGALLLRAPRPSDKPIVGIERVTKTVHLCQPCRGRTLEVVGNKLWVASYIDDDPEPTEVMTVGQMLGYHDAEMPYPELPEDVTPRDIVLQALAAGLAQPLRINKPRRPQRVMKNRPAEN